MLIFIFKKQNIIKCNMKNLNTYVDEAMNFKLTRNYKKPYNYFPKDRNELLKLYFKLVKERGKEANLNDIDTSAITDMSSLFQGSSFNGDISQWDVSNVKDMHRMFAYSDFTGKNGDISNWDVSNVEDMRDMFRKCPLNSNKPAWYKE